MNSKTKKIKMLLIKKDLTQSAIARKIGVTPKYVNHVIQGIRKNRRMRVLIARELGCKVSQIFSDAA
jgi:DNA-binding XRE family transcriptional regulator